ncbi:MAG: heme synthase [Aeromicrobium sp.]|nr:heme synthase [Aeromicrobium sp.]
MGVSLSRRPRTATVQVWAWATLVTNSLVILTGGLVRLTGSGLGCPTWPKCTDGSFVPHKALGIHGVVEFSNRMLTGIVTFVLVATVVVVWRWIDTNRKTRRIAVIIALGVPLQIVVGGISVRTDLNPWVVSLHLVISMSMVAASMLLVFQVRGVASGGVVRRETGRVISMYAVLWVVVYLGTIVTGSGPHAGDAHAPRNGLNPHVMSHVHAFAVYVLVAITIAVCISLRRLPEGRLALGVLGVELAQGTIGFVQYFTNLPIALVAAHLVGAAILVAVATRLLLAVVSPASESAPHPREVARRR